MRGLIFILFAALFCISCTDDSTVSRYQVCQNYCKQMEECNLHVLEDNFDTVENCEQVCVNYELEAGCEDGISNGCKSSMFSRWACVASLSCRELGDYFVSNIGIEWKPQEDPDYPCVKKDLKVYEECSEVSWRSYSPECGYDDEFDDF